MSHFKNVPFSAKTLGIGFILITMNACSSPNNDDKIPALNDQDEALIQASTQDLSIRLAEKNADLNNIQQAYHDPLSVLEPESVLADPVNPEPPFPPDSQAPASAQTFEYADEELFIPLAP